MLNLLDGTTPPAGANPGWERGYTPTAEEWNDWWSRKVDVGNDLLVGGPFLPIAGGVMNGPLTLAGPPISPLDAATKAYVDAITPAAGPFMSQAGGTFTGPVFTTSYFRLVGNPLDVLDAAPKQYVDAASAAASSAQATANAAVRRSGDTMTGPLILSGDPGTGLGAATRQYADTKLPLAGGTINGPLNVNGQFVAGGEAFVGDLHVNSFNGWEWVFSTGSNGDKYISYRAGWYDSWSSSGGARNWVGANTVLMTLDGSGNLNVLGQISTGNVINGGGFNTGGTVSGNLINGNTVQGGYLHSGGSLVVDGASTLSGTVTLNNMNANGVIQAAGFGASTYVNSGGTMGCAGNIVGQSEVIAYNGFFNSDNTMGFFISGINRYTQYAGNWYWAWDSTSGNLTWVGSGIGSFVVMSAGPRQLVNLVGPVGGTVFFQISDIRQKTNIAECTYGLDEVLKLEPIRFNRIIRGEVKDEVELGFSAQAVRDVLPEIVDQYDLGETGEATFCMTTTSLLPVLVNAVKQLAAEIAELKAARA